MAVPTERELARRGPWPGGTNNVAREDSVPPSQVRSAINVDFYPGGKVRSRSGTTQVINGAAHAFWSDGHYALVVQGNVLYRFVPGKPLTPIYVGLALDASVTYTSVNELVYTSDGETGLRIDTLDDSVLPWGVSGPEGQPTLTATANGGMDAGSYQVAVTWSRAGGEESGTLGAESVDVPDGGGIQLTHFGVIGADVDKINVYMTRANGTELMYYGDAPRYATSIQLYKNALGKALGTQFMQPLPPMKFSTFTNGRLFGANGPYLFWSDAFFYGLYNPDLNFLAFAGDITMVAAATPGAQSSGIFVAYGDRTNFISGQNPQEFASVPAYASGVVPGTQTYVHGSYFEDDKFPPILLPLWVAANGVICLGQPDGSVRPLTENKFVAATGERGAAIVRELNGIRQALFTIKPPTLSSPLTAVDSLTIVSVKNGITA